MPLSLFPVLGALSVSDELSVVSVGLPSVAVDDSIRVKLLSSVSFTDELVDAIGLDTALGVKVLSIDEVFSIDVGFGAAMASERLPLLSMSGISMGSSWWNIRGDSASRSRIIDIAPASSRPCSRIILRNISLARKSCEDEECGAMPRSFPISRCDLLSSTASLNTLRYPSGSRLMMAYFMWVVV